MLQQWIPRSSKPAGKLKCWFCQVNQPHSRGVPSTLPQPQPTPDCKVNVAVKNHHAPISTNYCSQLHQCDKIQLLAHQLININNSRHQQLNRPKKWPIQSNCSSHRQRRPKNLCLKQNNLQKLQIQTLQLIIVTLWEPPHKAKVAIEDRSQILDRVAHQVFQNSSITSQLRQSSRSGGIRKSLPVWYSYESHK